MMVPLHRSRYKRIISVLVVVFVVNTMLYAVRYISLPTRDLDRFKNLQEYKTNGERAVVFASRQRHLIDVCLMKGQKPPLTVSESTIPGKTIVETRNRILYCPVQKVGSTFWKKTLKAMSSQGRFHSPFQMKPGKKYKLELYQNLHAYSEENMFRRDWFMNNAISLIVVRDPYTKLFSAYADKLYHPNYLFWRIAGIQIEKMTKKQNGSACGNNVSFSDFIKYIISETNRGEKQLNSHFTPIHEQCHPCKTKYDYIMKFENFTEDFSYIINKWNARFNLNISFKDLEKESAIDIASKHIHICFATIKQFSDRCNIPIYNFLLRSWRFLQITGLLPKQVDMPFPNDGKILEVTREAFLLAVEDVLSRDIDWTEMKKQRHEALVQAYQSIDAADIKKLREIVRPDCQYFDYDETPDYLYEKSRQQFNYFDGISLS